jgi:acetyl/propionyl-CoA carboxylase alpha subunit
VVESLGRGRYLHSGIRDSGLGSRGDQGGHRIAFAVVDGSRTWVFIDGRTFIVADREPEARHTSSQTDDLVALSAPMPATVIAVEAVPGQEVQAGDTVIMLEAMKMELPIKAPRTARVKAIHCREGELVQAGTPLLELE